MNTKANGLRRQAPVMIGLVTALCCGGFAWTHAAAQSHVPEPSGKITPWEAMRIAVRKAPGRALSATFEFEDGHWIYGVKVLTSGRPKQLKELEIDATTGAIGDVEAITPEGEARETASELRAALGVASRLH